ncbi:MobC family plasmid mobilization relaxosome protein, partial [Enterobacter hormaechei]
DVKPARSGTLPSLSRALVRLLAGIGNKLKQIAFPVNVGGATRHHRLHIVSPLMPNDASLERLRYAVLE